MAIVTHCKTFFHCVNLKNITKKWMLGNNNYNDNRKTQEKDKRSEMREHMGRCRCKHKPVLRLTSDPPGLLRMTILILKV